MRSNFGIIASGHQEAAGSSFDPTTVPNLALWLDFTDTATITHTANAVSQVDDKSGNARHVTQATAGKQPITNTTTINGHNALDFSGPEWLERLTAAQYVGASDGNYTAWCIYKPSNVSGIRSQVDMDDEAGTRQAQAITTNGATFRNVRILGGVYVDSSGTISAGTTYVATAVQRTSNIEMYANGATDGSTATTGSNATGTSKVWIGNHGGAAQVSIGSMLAVLIYSRALTVAEMNEIGNGLATIAGTTWTTVT